MEHNTDRILWTVLILAIGVALYVGFRPAANDLLKQGVEKIQTVATNVNSNTSDSSSSKSSSNSNSSSNPAVGANLYTDTQNFDNLNSWMVCGSWNPTDYWTKTTDTYKGLAVMQTTDPWNGLSQYIPVKKGDVLTYSVYARYLSGTGNSRIYWQLNYSPESSPKGNYSTAITNPSNNVVTITDSWQRVSGTIVATSDGYLRPRLERDVINGNSNTLQIAGIKVEKGSDATPYTP